MIRVENLSFSYFDNLVLKDINFSIGEGEIVGILGNNGTGKSTLLKCVSKMNKINSGNIFLFNENIKNIDRNEISKSVAYVSQFHETSNVTVYDSVLIGRKPHIKFKMGKRDFDISEKVMKQLGLYNMKFKKINKLSGGEVQKVMIARALVQQPKLLLLDEPTNNLDPKNQHDILKFISSISKNKGISVLIVIHDINLAFKYCDKLLFLKEGEVHTFCDTSIVDENILKEVFDIESKIINYKKVKIACVN